MTKFYKIFKNTIKDLINLYFTCIGKPVYKMYYKMYYKNMYYKNIILYLLLTAYKGR